MTMHSAMVALMGILILIPVWRIFRRAGLHPAWSFLFILPIGVIAVLMVLAFSRWKKL